MDTPEATETTAEMLAAARQGAGFEPSKKQRDDWRRFGMTHGAIAQHGAGKKHGSIAYYPAGAGALLGAVCRRSVRKTPLRDVALLVWWDGYRLASPDLLRVVLGQAIDRWEQETAPWKDSGTPPAERRDDLERSMSDHLPGPLSSVRRDTGGSAPFASLVTALLSVAGGKFEGFQNYHGASVEDAETDAVSGLRLDDAEWFSGGLGTVFRQLAMTLRSETLRRALQRASDTDLDAARDECRLLDCLIRDAATIAARIGGPLLPFAVFNGYNPPPRYLGVFVVWWLVLRQFPVFQKALNDLRTATEQVTTLRQLLDTVPIV